MKDATQFRKIALPHAEWVTSLLSGPLSEAHVELLHNLSLPKRRPDAATGKSGRIDKLANELALAGKQLR